MVSKDPSQMRRVPFVTQNQNFLIQGDNGCIAAKKVCLEFGPQWCDSSQKYESPGVRNSTTQSLNSRRTLFDSMIHMKLFGSEFKANYFSIFLSFELQAHFKKRDSHRWFSKLNKFERKYALSSEPKKLFRKRITAFCANGKR